MDNEVILIVTIFKW